MQRQYDHGRKEAEHYDQRFHHCGPDFYGSRQQREPPRTPPHQQLFAAEPSAPRKRPAPHHEDLSVFEPARKRRAAVVKARKPYLAMDVHVKESGGLVAISPTGTICRCHLKPGAICHHEVFEPHVDDFVARSEYEQLSPIKQVLERRRVNQQKERDNEMKELEMDIKDLRREGEAFVRREKRREKRARQISPAQDDPAQDKWIHVPRDYDEGFVEEDDGAGGSSDDSVGEGSDSDDSEDNSDEYAEDSDESDVEDEIEENEDQASECSEDDVEDGGDGEGGNDDESSLADDEEIPYIVKPERR